MTSDAMCRYRYYYFAKCRHQETVLFDFCEKAQEVTAGLATLTVHDNDNIMGGALVAGEESVTAENNSEDLPSLCSTVRTCSSTHSSGSLSDTGLVSITAEPGLDCSSLRRADRTSHSSSIPEPASYGMAGLPLWSGTFRNWMTGGSNAAPREPSVDSDEQLHLKHRQSIEAVSHEPFNCADLDANEVQSHRGDPGSYSSLRRPGIRERTDESCDLPKRFVSASALNRAA